jgi:hypothetical protein
MRSSATRFAWVLGALALVGCGQAKTSKSIVFPPPDAGKVPVDARDVVPDATTTPGVGPPTCNGLTLSDRKSSALCGYSPPFCHQIAAEQCPLDRCVQVVARPLDEARACVLAPKPVFCVDPPLSSCLGQVTMARDGSGVSWIFESDCTTLADHPSPGKLYPECVAGDDGGAVDASDGGGAVDASDGGAADAREGGAADAGAGDAAAPFTNADPECYRLSGDACARTSRCRVIKGRARDATMGCLREPQILGCVDKTFRCPAPDVAAKGPDGSEWSFPDACVPAGWSTTGKDPPPPDCPTDAGVADGGLPCAVLSVQDCQANEACRVISGRAVDEAGGCLKTPQDLACVSRTKACDGVATTAQDATARRWVFPSTCTPPDWKAAAASAAALPLCLL